MQCVKVAMSDSVLQGDIAHFPSRCVFESENLSNRQQKVTYYHLTIAVLVFEVSVNPGVPTFSEAQ